MPPLENGGKIDVTIPEIICTLSPRKRKKI
jgi:hypothetical protein